MKLNEYPATIEAAQLDINAITRRLETLRDDQQQINDEFIREILRATNEQGKPLFSNESAREMELRARQIASEAWSNLHDSIQALKEAQATATAQIERLRGEFSIEKLELRVRAVFGEQML